MDVCIKGAAEDVRLGDIDEVCHEMGRILLATDGSSPSIAATEYAVMLAKTFGGWAGGPAPRSVKTDV